MKFVPFLALALVAAPSSTFAQECCGGAMSSGCTRDTAGASAHAGCQTGTTALPHALKPAFDAYIDVQKSLANDSFSDAQRAAAVLAKAVAADSDDLLPAKISQQVAALTKAADLEAARAAFKPLSESLIQYLKDQKISPGAYREAYCGMAKASWLQTDTTISNPYMGKEMPRCGQFKS